jgi:hypothetical protein
VSSSERVRRRVPGLPAALLVLLAACSPPVRQFDIVNQPLSCDAANRYVYRTVQAMGFAVSDFSPATPAKVGSIRGRRAWQGSASGEQRIGVAISCSPAGVTIDAREEGKWLDQITLKRAFYQSYTNILSMTAAEETMQEKIDAGTAPESQQRRDLQILVEPVRGQGSKLDFDIDLAAAGLLPLRISVNNHTARSYEIAPGKIRLTRADRKRAAPLALEQAAQRIEGARDPGGQPLTNLSAGEIADRLHAKLLVAATVRPGGKVSGYLYFPLAEYRRARVVVVEEESGEAEGFLVEF